MYRSFLAASILGLVAVMACSSSQQPEPSSPTTDEPHDEPSRVDDGMMVEGLRGTLRRDEVDPILNRAARRFQRCYVDQYMDHPYIVGDLALQFTINVSGSVETVWSPSATIGSRAVEECILDIARTLTFPRPHGGAEAQFDYGPMVMTSEDHHPFELWSISDLETRAGSSEGDNGALTESISDAGESCLGGSTEFQATLYIGPGGQVRSIGVVAPSATHQDNARCLEGELSSLEFPDPGTGQIVKLSLEF